MVNLFPSKLKCETIDLFCCNRKISMTAKKQTFEQQLNSLELIVEDLEKGELPLEDSLAQFEKGVKLTRECQKLLDKAQQKVAILSQDGDKLNDFAVE